MDYATETATALARKTGWPVEDARRALGDTSEYKAEGLTPEEAADAALDGLTSSN